MTHPDARAPGGARALQFADRRKAYREVDDGTPQIASRLIALSVLPGARVGYLRKKSNFFFEILLDAANARAVLAPVNWGTWLERRSSRSSATEPAQVPKLFES